MIKTILAGAALFAAAVAVPAQEKPHRMTAQTATGSFSVKMLPPRDAAPPEDGFVRLSLDKAFEGGLTGTSRVTMMATSDGKVPEGGYVALERFTGTLDGRRGTFVMQHSGVMAPGMMEIRVVISPGSGTGELAGLRGTLEIRMEGKAHFYTLRYELPPR